jgi:hypothetical protein
MRKASINSLWIACLLLLPMASMADNSTKADGYTIHHNAIPTAILTPEIASSYDIVRSKYRGMLNVSVIQEVPGTTGRSVSARIEARIRNLLGQTDKLKLREIRDGDAIYYVGEFPIVDRETLRFSLQVTPSGLETPISAELSQQFFID